MTTFFHHGPKTDFLDDQSNLAIDDPTPISSDAAVYGIPAEAANGETGGAESFATVGSSAPGTNDLLVGQLAGSLSTPSTAVTTTSVEYASVVPVSTASVSNDLSSVSPNASTSVLRSGLVINATYDSSITSLSATQQAQIEGAIQTAVQFYESEFTNPITVRIQFGWGELGGAPITGLAENSPALFIRSYSQVYSALAATDTTSPVQRTAVATLPASDPTGGATFMVTSAEAKALGLNTLYSGSDGSVGLNSSFTYSWTQGSIAAGTFDAVGAFEHEISEVLGRIAQVGQNSKYLPLDLFHYTAADGGSNDAPGSAAGTLDEPFVAGYNSNAFSYFSYDGKTVTNPFDTPSEVAAGNDFADWSASVSNDSYGHAAAGQAILVSPTDINEMNVLGYDLNVACFAAGTRIATADGEIPVEAVRPGMAVRSVLGGEARVVWVGHRQVDCRRHPKPELVWPVRIATAAFGAGRPRRDLYLSPDHAVYVGDALVPIRLLINGTTIRQVEVPSICYHHIEVTRHDVLLAEGLPAETYLDTGNRDAFQNGFGAMALHPDFAIGQSARVAGSCAPLLVEPAQIEMIWRALAERSKTLGWRVASAELEGDARLCLLIGGRYHEPVVVEDSCHSFVIPGGDEPGFLVSRAARPCDVRPWVDDRRKLGVAVRRLTLRRGAGSEEVTMDHPALTRGWWAVEWQGSHPYRWTDGRAGLPPLGLGVLEVRLNGVMDYPREASVDQKLAAIA